MKKEFENARILYVPIVSMRSYDTGRYNLDSDGNVNRAVSFFTENPLGKPKSTMIILPANFEGKDFHEKFRKANVDTDFGPYPENAKATREDDKILYERIVNLTNVFDFNYFIVESPALFKKLKAEQTPDMKIAFWNPVSKTLESRPTFMSDEALAELDEVSINADLLIVATKSQAEYYKKTYKKDSFVFSNFILKKDVTYDKQEVEHIQEFFNKMFSGMDKYFFPFRLTDKGYRFQETVDCLVKTDKPFVIFFTDPNESGIINDEFKAKYDKVKHFFVKVPTDRKTIYSFMKAVPCIYNESYDIHHASLEEIKYLHGWYYRLSDDNSAINTSRRFS